MKNLSNDRVVWRLEVVLWLISCINLGHRVPIYWLNTILGMSMRMFLDEINIHIGRMSEVECFSQCG